MFVIIVSECTKNAYLKSRRVLCDYLPQIANKTWAGKITQDGLEALYQKLKKQASKNTSIVCHLTKRNGREVAWMIGDKSQFTEDGEFAFATTQKDVLRTDNIKSELSQISQYVSTISAICHDIGKANQQFQEKIVSNDLSKSSDFMRHEAISLYVFNKLIIKTIQKIGKDKSEYDILKQLSDKNFLANAIEVKSNNLMPNGVENEASGDKAFVEVNTILKMKDKYPCLSTIYFLIVSHHKLPSGKLKDKGLYEANYSKHINNKQLKLYKDNNSIDESKNIFFNDEKSNFITSLSIKFAQLANAIESKNIYFDDIFPITSLYSRLSLILADRYISSKKDPNSVYLPNELYANSQIVNDKKVYAQTLQDHLVQVGQQCNSNFRKINNIINNKKALSYIEKERVPKNLKLSNVDETSAFYWQYQMIKEVKKRQREEIKDHGFFGILAAGTGTGKTRSAAKLMHALTEDLRYTLAVGLRTLTLQTGAEYIDELKLNKKDVAVLVGSDLSKKLFEAERAKRNSSTNASLGTDIDLDDEIDGEIFAEEQEDYNGLNNEILSLCREKEKQFLNSPVVVCTIDHLMSIANMTTGRHLISSLRVMTSDLILDEIDSYNDKDLVAIGKLIYRTALAGRKVILSSATIPSVIVDSFYECYEKGYKIYSKFVNKEEKIFAGWFSEFYDISKVKMIKDSDFFKSQHNNFINELGMKLSNKPAKRKGELLDIKKSDKDEAFKTIFDKCLSMHEIFNTEKDGIRISAGAVRFNLIKDCREFAKLLYNCEVNDDTCLKTMCYHSKNFPIILDEQEKTLNSLLKRKNELAIFEHPIIKNCLEKGYKNIVIIISTTSIEEVGRDHDFDYAIAEPSSNRSIVQFAGRVKRHREHKAVEPNFIILSNPLKIFDIKNSNKKIKESSVVINEISENPRMDSRPNFIFEKSNSYETSEIFDLSLIFDKIDATICVKSVDNNSSLSEVIEYNKKFFLLKHEGSQRELSLQNYIENPAVHVIDHHYIKNRFRESGNSMTFFKFKSYDNWFRFDDSFKDGLENAKLSNSFVKSLSCDLKYKERNLVERKIDDIFDDVLENIYKRKDSILLSSFLLSINFSLYNNESEDGHNNFMIEYDELLGAVATK